MNKFAKILESLKNNPKGDWKIDDIKAIATKYNVEYRQPGTSHVTFRGSNGHRLTIPAHNPIKAIYIKLFVDFIEEILKSQK